MDVSTKFVKLMLFCIFCSFFVSAADDCVKRSACSCVFPNGTGIDLAPSAKNSVYNSFNASSYRANGQVDMSTFLYHPCYDIKMATPGVVTGNNSCTEITSLCSYVSSWNITQTANSTDMIMKTVSFNYLGNISSSQFATDGSFIKYLNGPSSSLVYLVCAEIDDQLVVKDLSELKEIKLQFFSRNACLKQIDSGRSTGSTLLIVFFCFVIFYLVLGVMTKKFLMGATGVEVIPNLVFWTELPTLVKDGWFFMVNGFRLPARGPGPAAAPDPNSYDSI